MAGVTINGLTAVTSLSDTDLLAVWDGSTHKKITIANTKTQIAGKEPLWIPAYEWGTGTATTWAGDATHGVIGSNDRPISYRTFATGALTSLFYDYVPARAWDESVLTYQVYWFTTGTATGLVGWRLEALRNIDDDDMDISFGTSAVDVTDAVTASDDLQVVAESGNLNVTGTATGENTLITLQFSRLGATDLLTDDARLIGVNVWFTEDDTNDN